MPLFKSLLTRRALYYTIGGTAVAATGSTLWYLSSPSTFAASASSKEKRRPPPPWTPPTRTEMLDRLRASSVSNTREPTDQNEEFDLLVIGGGATGAGVALDAATRGLKVALVEREDFSSGTSSKSTKLVHGGVRYLQKAVFELDYSQYKLVREALQERKVFLETAPYLSGMIPIMLPVYKAWKLPYYYAGCKMYDLLAGRENLMETSSYFLSRSKALDIFPMLKSDGLVGAVVYYDGQHNDSRMNIALIMTAVKFGATVANYCEVTELVKDSDGKVRGAVVRDRLEPSKKSKGAKQEGITIKAKGVINATGPYTDSLLALDNPKHRPIVQGSSGVHITLPGYYSPRKAEMGLLDAETSDGRVIFFLPWCGNTIAGTTDVGVDMWEGSKPKPGQGSAGGITKASNGTDVFSRGTKASEEEIKWVLGEVRNYLSPDIKVRRGDVLSAWSGVRPLVRNVSAMELEDEASKDGKANTAGLVRSHLIHVSPSGLLTIAGGKWTTYRKMAEEAVDEAVKVFELQSKVKTNGCVTEKTRLVGTDGWSRTMFIGLIQTYGLETDVARHLSDSYGDRAWTVCSLAAPTGLTWPLHGKKLVVQYPFIEGEVRYATRHEYAQTAIDVLARRTRLSFLNARAALDALPRVVEIMSEDLGWDEARRVKEAENAVDFLVGSMGLRVSVAGKEGEGQGPEAVKQVKERMASIVRGAKSSAAKDDSWISGLQFGFGLGWIWRSLVGARMKEALYSPPKAVYGRARFEPGELSLLRTVFIDHSVVVPGSTQTTDITPFGSSTVEGVQGVGSSDVEVVETKRVLEILKSAPADSASFAGYMDVTQKEYDYVLHEAGLTGRTWLNFDEFVEVCGGLKEVSMAPSISLDPYSTRKFKRIPVEKSGGGV